jgi:hypothetical protein
MYCILFVTDKLTELDTTNIKTLIYEGFENGIYHYKIIKTNSSIMLNNQKHRDTLKDEYCKIII